ncbi:hypothetical protein [Novosphingobium guangzhouense]|uniref:Uncharacterized protein n=1 Tax=Novosphingobium guangzhouense TaxID=1850347 RepID=A0A2K2FW00_9SPHN|nr:hypothetical protein [Novosphingobium guangzhouense]PNU02961.1 hypothetical protein A8V01_07865 [Novosphingobium guangzhouense]
MTAPSRDRDPAALRFAIINLVRIAGVGFIVLGLLMTQGRILAGAPDWIAYLLIANGLADTFVIPTLLIRKWRTPK